MIGLENFFDFVHNWGYIAVFLGSLIEGESIILTACALAALGYLNIYRIMITAFIGTLLADQLLYYVGRLYGEKILIRFPRLEKHSHKALRLLKKYDTLFILSCRFIYGIRVISSIVIGMSGVPPKRFTPLNIIAAVIWTLVSCVGGYIAADLIVHFFHQVMAFQNILIGIGGGGLLAWKFWRYYKKSKRKSHHQQGEKK